MIGIWTGQILHFTCLITLPVLVYLGWEYLGEPVPYVRTLVAL